MFVSLIRMSLTYRNWLPAEIYSGASVHRQTHLRYVNPRTVGTISTTRKVQLQEAIVRRRMLTAACGQFLRVEGNRPSMMVVKLGCILGDKSDVESTQCGKLLYYSNYAISPWNIWCWTSRKILLIWELNRMTSLPMIAAKYWTRRIPAEHFPGT